MSEFRRSTPRSTKELSTTEKPTETPQGLVWSRTPQRIGTSKIDNLRKQTSPIKSEHYDDPNKLRAIELRLTKFMQEAQQRRKGMRTVGDPFKEAQRICDKTRQIFSSYNRQFPLK